MKVTKINSKVKACSNTIIKKTEQNIKGNLTPRNLPNSIGAVDEYYGATWIVSQEQLEKIKEIWEKVPKSLKDAIRSFN